MGTTSTGMSLKPMARLMGLAAVLASALQAGAAMITFDFEWTVTEALPNIYTHDFLAWGPVSVGDRLSGSLSYDPSALRNFVPAPSGTFDWEFYAENHSPIENRVELSISTPSAREGIPGNAGTVELRIGNSPGGSFLEILGEPARAELIGIIFEAPPGRTISEDFLPANLNVSDWSHVSAFFDFDAAGEQFGYFRGEVTSFAQRVPEGGRTSMMLLLALAALGGFSIRRSARS